MRKIEQELDNWNSLKLYIKEEMSKISNIDLYPKTLLMPYERVLNKMNQLEMKEKLWKLD